MNFRQIVNAIGAVVGFASYYFELLTPFWGLVFLYGAYHGVKSGTTFLFFETDKEDNPLLFWSLVLLWGSFGLYFLLYAFY